MWIYKRTSFSRADLVLHLLNLFQESCKKLASLRSKTEGHDSFDLGILMTSFILFWHAVGFDTWHKMVGQPPPTENERFWSQNLKFIVNFWLIFCCVDFATQFVLFRFDLFGGICKDWNTWKTFSWVFIIQLHVSYMKIV